MKRIALLALLCATLAMAQQQPAPPASGGETNLVERAAAPTYSDLNCAGFITRQSFSTGNSIVGGLNTPEQQQFAQRDIIFLEGGGYKEGEWLSVVRPLHDPNHMDIYQGQALAIRELGEPYAELGHVKVTEVRGGTAVAQVEFSCAAMVPGDLVVPFQERQAIKFRPPAPFDRFPGEAPGTTGRIVMAREFDSIVATGQKVYVNLGADKGIKPGDYLRVVRGYNPLTMDPVDALSYKAKHSEDTQMHPVSIPNTRLAQLPRRAVGELIVLNVTPTASTCMVTRAPETINVGDTVELERQ
jgi:hypothetical protein